MKNKLFINFLMIITLSLFGIGCAKSVTAPDNVLNLITTKQIEAELQKIGVLEVADSSSKGQYFDFSIGTINLDNNEFGPIKGYAGKKDGAILPDDLYHQFSAAINTISSTSTYLDFKYNYGMEEAPVNPNDEISLIVTISIKESYQNDYDVELNKVKIIITPSSAGWDLSSN